MFESRRAHLSEPLEPPDQDGPCLSSLFGGALWIARRESQLKSGPREAVGVNPSRRHGFTGSTRKRGVGSSVNQCSFSRSSRERESIARVFQRIDARQSAGDVLIPTWRLNSTMRIAMGCCETVVLGIPKPCTAMGCCVLSEDAGGDVRRVQLWSSARRSSVARRVLRCFAREFAVWR